MMETDSCFYRSA